MTNYKSDLLKHINDLEEASKDKNPQKFIYCFDLFSQFVIDHWTHIDYDIDSKTRKKIEAIFDGKKDMGHRTYEYVSLNLEPFMRFAFIIVYFYFLSTSFADLYG